MKDAVVVVAVLNMQQLFVGRTMIPYSAFQRTAKPRERQASKKASRQDGKQPSVRS